MFDDTTGNPAWHAWITLEETGEWGLVYTMLPGGVPAPLMSPCIDVARGWAGLARSHADRFRQPVRLVRLESWGAALETIDPPDPIGGRP